MAIYRRVYVYIGLRLLVGLRGIILRVGLNGLSIGMRINLRHVVGIGLPDKIGICNRWILFWIVDILSILSIDFVWV